MLDAVEKVAVDYGANATKIINSHHGKSKKTSSTGLSEGKEALYKSLGFELPEVGKRGRTNGQQRGRQIAAREKAGRDQLLALVDAKLTKPKRSDFNKYKAPNKRFTTNKDKDSAFNIALKQYNAKLAMQKQLRGE